MSSFNWPVNPTVSGPIEFLKDGNTTTVNQDTTTPANSEPLPVIPLNSSGQEVNIATEAKQDTQILELQDIEADLESIDANITTSNNTLSSIDTSLNNIEAVDFATEAKQDTQITELQSINSELDTQSTTLSAIDTSLNNIETDVDSIATSATSIDAEIQALNLRVAGSLVPEKFDYQALTYVLAGNGAGEVETVTYKDGGPSGTIVAVLTLAYDSSNRVISVTRT